MLHTSSKYFVNAYVFCFLRLVLRFAPWLSQAFSLCVPFPVPVSLDVAWFAEDKGSALQLGVPFCLSKVLHGRNYLSSPRMSDASLRSTWPGHNHYNSQLVVAYDRREGKSWSSALSALQFLALAFEELAQKSNLTGQRLRRTQDKALSSPLELLLPSLSKPSNVVCAKGVMQQNASREQGRKRARKKERKQVS